MKKKISGILVFMLSMTLCFGCGNDSNKKEKETESIVTSSLQDDSTNESLEESTTESIVDSTSDNTSEQETTTKKQEPIITRWDEGEYIVGKDVPVGEYVIFAKGLWNFSLYSDNTYKEEIRNGASQYYTYIKLLNNQCLRIKEGYMVPIEQTNFSINDSTYRLKTLKVGYNIEPGEYIIKYDTETAGETILSISNIDKDGKSIVKSSYSYYGEIGSYSVSVYDGAGSSSKYTYEQPMSEIILIEGDYIKYPDSITLIKK